ncbi:hypothetical protein ACFSM5_12485 [Lacibacterium aquatile]|uniref:Uncharacterized protein n=1 Tax=Lacibacterium aquatile TaxID=1168082 RepID=A0ABW5DTE0_9PROT
MTMHLAPPTKPRWRFVASAFPSDGPVTGKDLAALERRMTLRLVVLVLAATAGLYGVLG